MSKESLQQTDYTMLGIGFDGIIYSINFCIMETFLKDENNQEMGKMYLKQTAF
jgi:hypothetical protein